jgi:lambda family phage portal protein
MPVLDASGRPVPAAEIARLRAEASAFRAASTVAQETAAWRPANLSADAAILPEKEVAEARTRDLVRNDPHARAAVGRLVDMLVGAGLRLSAKPDAAALGVDPKALRDVRRQIEAEWRLFANDPLKRCDAQRRVSFNGLMRLLGRTFVLANECAAVLTWRPEPGARYATCLRVVHPSRISNPDGRPDDEGLRGGVEINAWGEPVAYHVRNRHPGDWLAWRAGVRWERVPRQTAWGRPVFVHGFEPEEEDQTRAITPFAALVVQLRMLGKFADHELSAAALNALFAAFVKSNAPAGEVAQSFAAQLPAIEEVRRKFYKERPPILANGTRIPVLPAGDEIVMNASPRQTAAFRDFQSTFLQAIASALGISYEQLSMDWSRTNYSSARAALNEVWRTIRRLFAVFVDQVVTPVYLAWLEEAFDRGFITAPAGAPSFWDLPGAWAQARWIGPGRGYVDPVKEAEAASMRIDGLMSTLEAENAEQGLDWEETVEQIAFENEQLAARGITRTSLQPRGQPADTKDQAP